MEVKQEMLDVADAARQLNKLQRRLQDCIIEVNSAVRLLWHELIDPDTNNEKLEKDHQSIEKLTLKAKEIHLNLSEFHEQVFSGLSNSQENCVAESAVEDLPKLTVSLIREASDLTLFLFTINESFNTVACPARIIRKKLGKIIKMPKNDIDDLILPKKTHCPEVSDFFDEDEGHGTGF